MNPYEQYDENGPYGNPLDPHGFNTPYQDKPQYKNFVNPELTKSLEALALRQCKLLTAREEEIYTDLMKRHMPAEIFGDILKKPIPDSVGNWLRENGWHFETTLITHNKGNSIPIWAPPVEQFTCKKSAAAKK